MIPKQYRKITFTILMGMSMAFFITFINIVINVLGGMRLDNIMAIFLVSWFRATLISIPVAYFIVPIIQRVVDKLVEA